MRPLLLHISAKLFEISQKLPLRPEWRPAFIILRCCVKTRRAANARQTRRTWALGDIAGSTIQAHTEPDRPAPLRTPQVGRAVKHFHKRPKDTGHSTLRSRPSLTSRSDSAEDSSTDAKVATKKYTRQKSQSICGRQGQHQKTLYGIFPTLSRCRDDHQPHFFNAIEATHMPARDASSLAPSGAELE